MTTTARTVYRNTATLELYVEVPGGLIDALDYVADGGRVWHRGLIEPLEELGRMTDAAIVDLVEADA